MSLLLDKPMMRSVPLVRLWPVIVPVVLAIIYYGAIASDRYVTTASFIVRNNEAPKVDVVSAMMGLPGQSQSVADTYILRDYFYSPDALAALSKTVPLAEAFNRKNVDFLSRLGRDVTQENLEAYWRDMLTITIDKSSGIATMQVRAYTAEDSLAISQALLKAGEARLNDMTLRSRRDTISVAETELAQSIDRLNDARARLTAFRQEHNMLDPEQALQARQNIATRLEQELVEKTAERATLQTYMQPTAPQVVSLTKRIDSLRALLDQETSSNIRSLSGKPSGGKSAALIDEYNQMVIDREVAEKTYVAATQFLTTARIEGMTQLRYISVFSEPVLPQQAIEPHRIRNIGIVLVFALLVWGIGQMIVATIKEHRQWNL